MTIPTNTFSDKRPAITKDLGQNLIVHTPPVDHNTSDADNVCIVDVDRARRSIEQRRSIARLALLGIFLLATSLVMLGWAITTGRLYYGGAGMQRQSLGYHGFCAVPYGSDDSDGFGGLDFDRSVLDEMRIQQQGLALQAMLNVAAKAEAEMERAADAKVPFFMEEFQLGGDDFEERDVPMNNDSADEGYARVTIPVFRDGRSGSFLHDFRYNQSLIVDRQRQHCFVMPLDRDTVLKPRSLLDLVEKMNQGFYNINTELLRKNMRVVLPPLDDAADVAPRIRAECGDMPIFQLEPFTGRVFKRSTDALPENARYAHFSGSHIVEVDFVNYPQLQQYLADRK